MPIFRRYVEDLWGRVPTLLRRKADNIYNLTFQIAFEGFDAIAEALQEFVDQWPIDEAPGWLLDQHWLPMHALSRNGLTDDECRRFNNAKRLLNASWGSAHQAIRIFKVLLPTATFQYAYFPVKSWTVTVLGVDMATAEPAIRFMEKKPSPLGGGFSVAGDNGQAIIVDPEALNFSSVHGVVPITGWFGSVYGAGGGTQAGWAHAGMI